MIKIEGQRQLNRTLTRLAREFPKETSRALTKTSKRAATRTRRQVAKDVGLPQRMIKDRVQGFRARIVNGNPESSVWVGTKVGIPLSQVPGARVNLRTGILAAGRTRTQTFKATMPSGHKGIFVRKPNSRHKKRSDGQWTELPIEEPKVRIGKSAAVPLLRHSAEQMTTFFPKELRRLVELKAKRLAAKR